MVSRRRFENVAFVYASEPEGMEWFKVEVVGKDIFKGYDVMSPYLSSTFMHSNSVYLLLPDVSNNNQ